MLKISIIIPVYKVQGFLRECLDSILASSYPHLEVIGVNDCSPDQSGQILAEFAAADPRVRALRTPHNGGSGAARNLGLDQASGDYVWFVDSDDVIAPGSIERIIAKLTEYEADARPDVLIFDYQRLTETGELLDGDLPGLIRTDPPPAAFTFSTWPTVARYTHTTWNKVVRRDFLVGLGLRFHPGWYQDVPWTYPLLLAAEHMALLDTVGYHYRQRRAGSVTRTASDRHFEVLMQWQRVWSTVDERAAEPTRHAMFHRLIWHCTQVLGNDDRIMPQARRAFFQRVADLYAQCHPGPGYRRPGGIEGTKHHMLQRRWYFGYLLTRALRRCYNVLRFGHPFGRGFSRGRFAVFASLGARARVLLAAKGMAGFGWLYYLVQTSLAPKPDLVVLAVAGHGRPSGACAAIDAKLGELHPRLRRVWLTTAPRPGDTAAKPGSAAYFRALARAAHLVTDFEPPDFVVKREGTVHVRVLSQTPVEALGLDRLRVDGGGPEDVRRLFARLDRWNFVVSPNRHASEVVDRAFQIRAETLEFGLPGRDSRPDETRRKQIREDLGIGDEHDLVCYHPAERPEGMDPPGFDLVRIQRQLPDTTVLLLRDGEVVTRAGVDGVLVSAPLPAGIDAADLYEVADVMIGDYRGALVDRAVAGLPVLLYLPDWKRFNASGLVTTDLTRACAGPVAHDRAILTEQLRRLTGQWRVPGRDRPQRLVSDRHTTGIVDSSDRLRQRFGDWRGGDAADAVVQRIFGMVPKPATASRPAPIGSHATLAAKTPRPQPTTPSPIVHKQPGTTGPSPSPDRSAPTSGESTGVR